MTKFKNKKTGTIVEENLLFYKNLLRRNPNFKEITDSKEKVKNDKGEEVNIPRE